MSHLFDMAEAPGNLRVRSVRPSLSRSQGVMKANVQWLGSLRGT
jgi:hypothetical protein